MDSGIYIIYNLNNGRYYIGSSKNSIHSRLTSHYNKLCTNKHHNKLLQMEYNHYGADSYIFIPLEFCEED
ncbi:MAG: GIY-YIG nuclease family protein, partial [Romboutsia sp.]|nr:GIY-YIG nuclease family protein [Romboutsia sp.]